jgi:nitrite reductase/ring-hydroxylating ferredoxin subunit
MGKPVMGFVKVISTRELPLGSMKGVEAGGKPVLVANFEGKYYAIGNVCTHMGCTLTDGTLNGEVVTCPCHGSKFNVKNGNVVGGPAKKPEPAYQVKAEGDQVLISV